jgi:hypothetical protein
VGRNYHRNQVFSPPTTRMAEGEGMSDVVGLLLKKGKEKQRKREKE